MACQEDAQYMGKNGKAHITITASISAANISDAEIASGEAVSTGILTFAGATQRTGSNGGTGTIKMAILKVNNDNTAAITSAFNLYLFNNSDLSSQTTSSAVSLNTTDWSGFLGYKISWASLESPYQYLSYGNSGALTYPFTAGSNDTALYGFLTAGAAVTFDA